MKSLQVILACFCFALLSACDGSGQGLNAVAKNSDAKLRWYEESQAVLGAQVFSENCAVCHGVEAEGLYEDWKQRLDDGSFPPPPLNGSAHAWHHPLSVLLQVIDYGGEGLGGNMPAFIDQLEQSEKLAAIAYFQSFWSDEIYANWQQMGGTN